MSTNVSAASGQQLWGIYYTDREYARLLGDPLRTVIEAPNKQAAEKAAGKLGFESPGRIRSPLNKPAIRFGFHNRNDISGNCQPASIHTACTSDYANTNHRPTPDRY